MKNPGTVLELTSQLITVATGSMAADITSPVVDTTAIPHFATQFTWSGGGSPVGNILVQASLSDSGTDFATISTTAVSGNSGSVIFNTNFTNYRRVRIVYSRTSGTGAALAYFAGMS